MKITQKRALNIVVVLVIEIFITVGVIIWAPTSVIIKIFWTEILLLVYAILVYAGATLIDRDND